MVINQKMRNHLYKEFRKYLKEHGGQRPVTPDSTHTGIDVDSVSEFEDKWDLLQL